MPVMSSFTPAFDPRGAGREGLDHVRKGQEIREAYDKRKREREARKYLEENPGRPRPEDMWSTEEESALPDDTPPPRRAATEPVDSALPTADAYQSEAYQREERPRPGQRRTSSRVEDTGEALPTDGYTDAPVAPRPGQRRTSSRVEDVPPGPSALEDGAAPAEESPEAVRTKPRRVIDHDKWDAKWEKERQALLDAGRTDEAAKIDEEKLKAEFIVAESILARHQQGIDANDPLAMKDALDEIGQLNPIFQNISDAVELGEDGTLTMGGEKFDKRHMYAVMMNMDQYRQLALEQIAVDKGRSEVAQTRQATRTSASQARYLDSLANAAQAQAAFAISNPGARRGGVSTDKPEVPEAVAAAQERQMFEGQANGMFERLDDTGALGNFYGMYASPEAIATDMYATAGDLLAFTKDPNATIESFADETRRLQEWKMGLGSAEDLGIQFHGVDPKTGMLRLGFTGRPTLDIPADSRLANNLVGAQLLFDAMQAQESGDEEGASALFEKAGNIFGAFGDREFFKDMNDNLWGADNPLAEVGRNTIDSFADNVAIPLGDAVSGIIDYGKQPVRDILSEDVFPGLAGAWDLASGWVRDVAEANQASLDRQYGGQAPPTARWSVGPGGIERQYSEEEQARRARIDENTRAARERGRSMFFGESDEERRQREAREARDRRVSRVTGGE